MNPGRGMTPSEPQISKWRHAKRCQVEAGGPICTCGLSLAIEREAQGIPLIPDPESLADPKWCRECGASDWTPDGTCGECGATDSATTTPTVFDRLRQLGPPDSHCQTDCCDAYPRLHVHGDHDEWTDLLARFVSGGIPLIDVERWEPAVHAEWALADSLADAGQDPYAAAAVLAYLEGRRGVTIAVNAVERDYWLARLSESSPVEEGKRLDWVEYTEEHVTPVEEGEP